MGESGDSSSFWKGMEETMSRSPKEHIHEWKKFWSNRLAFLDNYTRFLNRESPLPPWSDSDVDAFISVDPVHGPVLQLAREVRKFSFVGTAVGAGVTAAFAWKYSKSPHGTLLALGAGAIFGMTFGQEIGSHTYQMYRYDPMAAQVKFMEWWEKKTEERS